MGIDDFFGDGKRKSRVERFEEKAKGCESKAELRRLEMQMLGPEGLRKHTGEKPKDKSTLDAKIVKLVFQNNDDFELFQKYFKVYQTGVSSCTNFRMITDMLHAVETGELKYDTDTRQFTTG